jgi:hypothetical protein
LDVVGVARFAAILGLRRRFSGKDLGSDPAARAAPCCRASARDPKQGEGDAGGGADAHRADIETGGSVADGLGNGTACWGRSRSIGRTWAAVAPSASNSLSPGWDSVPSASHGTSLVIPDRGV